MVCAAEKPGHTLTADGVNWLVYPQGDVVVKPGSALDFSSLVESGPAGQHGFAIVNAKGQLVFEKQPDKPIRLMGCAYPMMDFKSITDQQIAALAQQIQMAGYNAVRPHWLDIYLMDHAPADCVFNPERLACFDRFAFELKQRGIYLVMDGVTSRTMYKAITETMGGDLRKEMLKLRLYYEPEYQANWKQGVKALLEHVNPLTGTALKDDPQMVYIAARNEPGIGFQMPVASSMRYFEKGIKPAFIQWLKNKYKTMSQLKKAWGDVLADCKTFDAIPTPKLKADSVDAQDLHRFITDYEIQTYAWMRDYLLSVGVKCPIIDYNNGMAVQCAMTRGALPMVDMHAYHDHPLGWSVNAKMNNRSLVASGAAMAYRLAGSSHLGAPLLVSEWGNPYFNEHRYECGMVMGAYASLQDWQMIIQHALPVEMAVTSIPRFFRVGKDPSLKPAERMATLLYASHAVAPAKGVIGVKLDEKVADKLGWTSAMSSNITRLALISKLGLQLPASQATRAPVHVDLQLDPQQGAKVVASPGAEEASEQQLDMLVTQQAVAALRRQGIIRADNRTDVAANVYQSDTGQLMIMPDRGLLSVDAPTSQGVTMSQAGETVQLRDTMWQLEAGRAACLLTALDRKPLGQSQRMLLIVAVNSQASESRFTEDGRQILAMGHMPMLMEAVKLSVTLRAASREVHVWALAADGSRMQMVAVSVDVKGQVTIPIDLTQLGDAITPYFEVQVD
jgi:hypothetical protein